MTRSSHHSWNYGYPVTSNSEKTQVSPKSWHTFKSGQYLPFALSTAWRPTSGGNLGNPVIDPLSRCLIYYFPVTTGHVFRLPVTKGFFNNFNAVTGLPAKSRKIRENAMRRANGLPQNTKQRQAPAGRHRSACEGRRSWVRLAAAGLDRACRANG
jgi:hypothetical protein